jgi:hypothetical protein
MKTIYCPKTTSNYCPRDDTHLANLLGATFHSLSNNSRRTVFCECKGVIVMLVVDSFTRRSHPTPLKKA